MSMNYPSGLPLSEGVSGAFSNAESSKTSASYKGIENTTGEEIKFDASKVSEVYGLSETVQPKSIRVLLLIRY